MSEQGGSNVGKIIGCGCGGIVLLGLIGVAVLFFGISKAIKSSPPYKAAIEAVNTHPAATEALGEPIEPGLIPSGSVNFSNGTGETELTIPVSGPEGEGKVIIEGKLTGDNWDYETFELQVEGQQDPIPLGQ